eukprot:896716-Amphidinium_carterae.1
MGYEYRCSRSSKRWAYTLLCAQQTGRVGCPASFVFCMLMMAVTQRDVHALYTGFMPEGALNLHLCQACQVGCQSRQNKEMHTWCCGVTVAPTFLLVGMKIRPLILRIESNSGFNREPTAIIDNNIHKTAKVLSYYTNRSFASLGSQDLSAIVGMRDPRKRAEGHLLQHASVKQPTADLSKPQPILNE